MMTDIYENLTLCINEIRKKTDMIPETAIVLGSGLNQYSTYIQNACIINYGELSNFPVSTNKMHHGRFIFGYVDKKPVVAMDGRIHRAGSDAYPAYENAGRRNAHPFQRSGRN